MKELLSGVDKVTVGRLGEFTILPSHADFMSTLLSGNLVVTAEGEQKIQSYRWFCWGFR